MTLLCKVIRCNMATITTLIISTEINVRVYVFLLRVISCNIFTGLPQKHGKSSDKNIVTMGRLGYLTQGIIPGEIARSDTKHKLY